MFYDFLKLVQIKQISALTDIKCIVISQSLFDFSIVDMIISGKVKYVINCVDYIYKTESLQRLRESRVRMVYLPGNNFHKVPDRGKLFVNKNCITLDNIDVNDYYPDEIPIDLCNADFVNNALEYMTRDKDLMDQVEIIENIPIESNTAIIISRGLYTEGDINYVRYIIRKYNPVIISVEEGYDLARRNKIKPHIVIGDMNSISERAINECSQFVIQNNLNCECPAKKRISLNKKISYIKCFGNSEDAAILYCIKNNVKRVYTLGFHTTIQDFLGKDKDGMASSALIRMFYGNTIRDIRENESFRSINAVPFAIFTLIIIYIGIFLTRSEGVFR